METKKNLGKKLLSLLLTLLMVISLVPLSVFSAFAEEAADSAEALAELSATIDTDTTVTISDTDGDGYYEIGNADELYAFAALVNGGNSTINAQLTADITVNTGVLNENGELVDGNYRDWTPIGNSTYQYSGTFDGCEYTVSGLYFNDSSVEYVGLFGYVSRGAVENIGVIASYFNGYNCVGGVVGYNNSNSTVTNCYNTGSVSGTNYVGGVVGYNNSNSTVTNCYNEGAVSGNGCVGGVVGENYNNSTVTNCYNTGSVSSSSYYVGGVVGNNGSSTVTNCYNTGSVNGSRYVGGVAGWHYGDAITNCYNTGSVNGSMCVGGVVGYNYYYSTVTNCYNTGTVSGSYKVGGVVGGNYDNSTVTNCYNTGSVSGSNNVGGVVGYNYDYSTATNCFYLADSETDDIDGTTFKTSAQFASGEVAYLLQGEQTEQVWGQNIDNSEEVQKLPVFSDAKVYYGYVSCADNATAVYTNTSSASAEKPGHDWVDGVCTVCYKNCEHDWNTDTGICNICELECTHEGELKAEYDWNEPYDGECYVYAEFRCAECGRYIASESGNATVSETVEAKDCMNPGYEAYSVTFGYNGTEYTDTKKFTVNSYNHTGECVNGFCPDCGGYEMPELVEGGEYGEYYAIENAGQLYWFADYINNVCNEANAVLVKDIVVNESLDAENLREWTPIGTDYANTFYGSIDGQGHTISGLYCDTEDSYVGLLGYASGNYPIKNLGIINSFFKGTDYVGALAGYAEVEASGCYVADTVTVGGNTYNVGGLIGSAGGTLTNCYSLAQLEGENTAGLVGSSYTAISNCFTNASALINNQNSNYGGSVENCYYLADDETDSFDGTTAKTAQQFASGEVAYLLQEGVVGEEIYDEELEDWVTAEPAEIWGQSIGTDAYPVLGGAKVYLVDSCDGSTQYSNTEATEDVHVGYENGFCTVCDGYQPAVYNEETKNYEISNAGQLYWFADKVNNDSYGSANAVLTKDVVVNEGVLNEDGELVENENYRSWTPIGNIYSTGYSGTFDGCGFTVSGLYINDSSVVRVGLFGVVDSGGAVKNIGLVDSYISAGGNAAGIVANLKKGSKIDSCYNASTIIGGIGQKNIFVGGVVSAASDVNITNCYNTGSVINMSTGGGRLGGVVASVGSGFVRDLYIENCYNTGTLSGSNASIGGICDESYAHIIDCYNSGDINGNISVGGIAGTIYGEIEMGEFYTVRNCYNTGDITGITYCGGIAGNANNIICCENSGNVTGTNKVGGIVGRDTGVMTNNINRGDVTGDEYVGGISGESSLSSIYNCYNVGTVSCAGEYVGGVTGYSSSPKKITDCYYLADSETDSIDGTTYKTTDQFASGEVAYLLQGEQEEQIWGQNIDNGKDVQTTPVFSDAKVYAVTNCIDEIVTYSNTDQTADHTWVNGICSVCGKVQNDKLAGYSISLGDKIAVNYFMLLTDTTVADTNAKMVFTVPDTGSTYTVEIPVSEATVNGDYYVFTCEVAAKEMTSVIKAKLVTSDSELVLDDYSVQKYAEIILSDAEKYAKEQELVKAMLNYGAYAQLYFNYNTSNLTNSILEEADKALVETLDISAYANSVSGEQDGVNFIGGLLSLKSETAIKLYFEIDSNVDIASLDITVNGEKAEAVKNGNYYEIKISDIPAHELDEMFVVKVGDLTVNYGAFSYGNAAMSTGKETLINIVKAMYAYNQAANTYIG